ncbi:hypothetical protein SAMN04488072_11472 [Lentibacillus halodurans]|uniref:PH domain-containing protein n=1 Tax=Lentibacillus halodurans TaxID=237679 RepID=A0A1I0ZZC1_9BACI|nr:hypothetical protein [Lentibacillus halodurans]SFB30426.1 hypothetical protein SAMN04488072_11472 [Lentibacillus halodurans]
MKLIAEQPYIKVEREMTSISQNYVEDDRRLYLYHDRILSKHHEFPIEQVWDMSYRPVDGKGGLLYLHTSKGVHVYTVKESPDEFIEAFKKLKKSS